MVIEDASHALGAQRAGAPVGGAGGADLTTFSFHPVKAMTTGEGGAVATEDDELARRLRLFRTHGITKEGIDPSPTEGDWYYEMQALGFNYRITDFQCALGLSQLAARRVGRGAERHRRALPRAPRRTRSEWRCRPPRRRLAPRRITSFRSRSSAGAEARLAVFDGTAGAGIGVQVHYIPIYRLPYYRDVLGHTPGCVPGGGGVLRSAISLSRSSLR